MTESWPDARDWSMGQRINFAIERASKTRKGTQQALADLLGVSRGAVSQWKKTGNIEKERITPVARFLGAPPGWVLNGEPVAGETSEAGELVRGNPRIRNVPVISYTAAGVWCDADDPYPVGEGRTFEPVADVGPHCFILEVEGRSMEPEYRAGSMIVVDPETEAQSGDPVVAKHGGQTTFKELVLEGGKRFLVPLNEQFPTLEMSETDELCGVVVRHIRNPRKERRRH